MKKIWLRFIICFTVGLLAFTVYFLILFPLILKLIQPGIFIEHTYYIEGDSGPVILAFLACFLSGGFLFSLFFVKPIYQILLSINRLSNGENLEHSRLYRKNKLKASYLLYKEIIDNLQTLEQGLGQAEQSRKEIEAAKSDWLAGVSHDLKTPLSYISGYSSLLLTPGYSFSQKELEHHLTLIYQKSVYIKSLINDMNSSLFQEDGGRLNLSLERIELVEYLQAIVSDMAENPQALSNDFSFVSQADKVYLDCDPKLLLRALYNLLYNCVIHNPEGTSIIVTIAKERDGITIEIEDNGVGLEERELAIYGQGGLCGRKNFDQRKGLGLYIAKTIFEAHGATFKAENLPKAGSRFSVIWKTQDKIAQ